MGRAVRNPWVVSSAVLAIGLLLLVGSFFLDRGWWSGTLVELGATLFLFAPLLLLSRHFENRLDTVQRNQKEFSERVIKDQGDTKSRIDALAEDVAQTQEEVRRTHQELSDAVITRLAAARESDGQLFEELAQEPDHRSVARALMRADFRGLISLDGCRITLEDTDTYIRFWPPEEDVFPLAEDQILEKELNIHIETVEGNVITNIDWHADVSAEDFLVY